MLFGYSLEGIALDQCQSLPKSSTRSLAYFHAAFHVFCKDQFPNDFLYPECCHEFSLLNKDSDCHEGYAEIGDTSRYDQDIDDLQDVNHSIGAFDIVPNASVVLSCDEDHTVPFGNLEDDEQINRSTDDSFGSAVDVDGSSQFPELQIKGSYSNHEELGNIFPNLFQDLVADNLMQESSSLSLAFYHDIPIFDKYRDEEEYFKVYEDLSTYGISSSSNFQQRYDKKCVHPVVDDSYEFIDQNSSDTSCK